MKDLKLIQRRLFVDDTLYVYMLAKEPSQPTTYLFARHSEVYSLGVDLPKDGDYGFTDYPLTARALLAKQNFEMIDILRAQYQIVGCYNPLNALEYTGTAKLIYQTREDGGDVTVRLMIDDHLVDIERYPGLVDAMHEKGCYPGLRYGFVMLPGTLRVTPNVLITSQRHFRKA